MGAKTKKKIRIIVSSKEFEEFVNDEGINILQLDVKATENTYYTQESFMAVAYYEEAKDD